MSLLDELQRFRVIDAHAHNWSLFADTEYFARCLDRFDLKAIALLSNLTGGYDPEPDEVAAANAAIDHVHDWVLGTPDGDWVSMAVPSDGSYGVPEGLMSSFPMTCADGEWSIVQGLEIDDFSRARIDASAAELAEERDTVRELGLI